VRRTVIVSLVSGALGCGLSAYADTIELPTPEAARVQQSQLILAVQGRPDRLLRSDVPGPVVNDEVVRVGIGGDGGVRTVQADQRLELTGEGDYAIRERGPARSASSLSAEPPPITRRGAVVWQGFSPGRRDLAARLVLDPLIESSHLPLTVSVAFAPRDGRPLEVLDGGHIPGPGTVTVTVTNVTSQPQVLPTAADVDPRLVAASLDRALAVARRPSAARLPSTDNGLPRQLTVSRAAKVQSSQAVPYRLRGSLRLAGTTGTVRGPATTPTATGATFDGTLGGSAPQNAGASVTFTVVTAGAGQLVLDLTAISTLNTGELAPPGGFATWARWAAANPPPAERQAALDLLVAVAATGARASSYSPYLGADLNGTGSTTFSYGFASPLEQTAALEALHPRWGAIALAGIALLLLLTNGVLIWRRS
jgi:hypothetical protein